jgi:hypothetical protein
LNRLDAALSTLDELNARQREFPRHVAEIDTKLKKLAGEDLSTLEALESHQAQQGKLADMKLLAGGQAKKTQVYWLSARDRSSCAGTRAKLQPLGVPLNRNLSQTQNSAPPSGPRGLF